MSERVILHSDLNNYFASVECLANPGLKALPLAVCGDVEARCGVILAKNEVAKSYGIRTGDTVFAARKKCKDLILCATHFDKYVAYSKKVRQIYERFTDQVEAFSIDECFLDVTESAFLFGSGEEIAEKIRRTVKEELSLTVSVGVSFNKVFAKIASDMKKPDAVTVIDRENYREKLWPLPVRDMLYVGASTERTLEKLGIHTIGQLARYPEEPLVSRLGKWGHILKAYARGEDDSPVATEEAPLKSIGNSITTPKDLYEREEVRKLMTVLAESVARRLRQSAVGKADTVHIVVKDNAFQTHGWQRKIPPTVVSGDIAQEAFMLFCEKYTSALGIRMLGISVSGFDGGVEQLSFLDDGSYQKRESLERALDRIREKYGRDGVQRGSLMGEEDESIELAEKRLTNKHG